MKRHRLYDELNAFPQSKELWKEIIMDFIINLPLSKRRGHVYDAIFVVVDRYIKMVRYLLTIKKIDVVKLLNLFYKKIALKFDIFDDVVIDRESVFTSAFWSEVCFQWKVKRRLSIVFHPQIDG